MNYRIIGDSCMDLTEEQRKDPHFTLIPFTLMVEDHQFIDDENFDSWHNYYFSSAAVPSVYLDEMGFLQYFTQNGDNWAFLPVSVAKSILKNTPVSIHELDVELPNRTLYYLYRAGDESPYQEHLLEICRQKLAGESGITLMEPILNL